MSDQLTGEMISDLCAGSDVEAIKAALREINLSRLSIEQQLSKAKGRVKERIAELVRTGAEPRHADILAKSSEDPAWRASAVTAQKRCETRSARLRARLAELPGTPQNATARPDRQAVLMRGTSDEIRENLQSWLDDGYQPNSSAVLSDGVLFVMKRWST